MMINVGVFLAMSTRSASLLQMYAGAGFIRVHILTCIRLRESLSLSDEARQGALDREVKNQELLRIKYTMNWRLIGGLLLTSLRLPISRGVRNLVRYFEKSVRNQRKSMLEIRNQSEIGNQKSNRPSARRTQTP